MGVGSNLTYSIIFVLLMSISEWVLMSISEHCQYRNDSFQSDIFVSDIGITDVDVGCRISPTLRSMSMPTYASRYTNIARFTAVPDRRVQDQRVCPTLTSTVQYPA